MIVLFKPVLLLGKNPQFNFLFMQPQFHPEGSSKTGARMSSRSRTVEPNNQHEIEKPSNLAIHGAYS